MYILPYISLNGFGGGVTFYVGRLIPFLKTKFIALPPFYIPGYMFIFNPLFQSKITVFIQITLYWSSYIIAVTILKLFLKLSSCTCKFKALLSHMQFYFNWKLEFRIANSGFISSANALIVTFTDDLQYSSSQSIMQYW